MKYQRWLNPCAGFWRFYFIKYENFMYKDIGVYFFYGGWIRRRQELIFHLGFCSMIIDIDFLKDVAIK